MQSVKKPGVIKSKPEISKKIPPLISSVGIIPCERLRCALNNKLSELPASQLNIIARESLNDESFLRQYLTEEDCQDLNYFSTFNVYFDVK